MTNNNKALTHFLSIAILLLSIFTVTNEQHRVLVKDTDKVNKIEYQSVFKIPSIEISFQANDDMICNFSQQVTVDRLIYQAENTIEGFSDELSIYYLNHNNEYILLDKFETISTNSKVMFIFSHEITTGSIKLEFAKTKIIFSSENEFQFFQPEYEKTMNILNLLDYSHTRVKEGTTFDLLNEIELESKNNINYGSEIKPILERAHDILTGKVVFDPRREFSTKPGSKNLIRRHGELKDFMLNHYKMVWAGTNKQATGIFGYSEEKFIIRVEADEKDPLPKAKFTQHIGRWSDWQTKDFDLKLGENEFTFPSFKEHTAPFGGGPFYLTNPYFEDEQSENVKVYIESGVAFPLFRRGSDEKEFMTFLEEYVKLVKSDPKKYFDLMEIEGTRILHTIDAVRGYDTYSKGHSPEENIERWDEYLKLLFKYDGVEYEKTEPTYTNRTEYMNLNIRHMVQYGEAYAFNEHVGIFYDYWLDKATFAATMQVMDWGFAHEIGHTMDIGDRTVSETSNNMISKYDETVIRRDGTRGEYESTLRCLTPDGIDDDKRGDGEKPFWQAVELNFLVWWQIESLYPGYWGKLDNLYRYSFPEGISRTERMVYLSSVVTKLNMSYHFSRWGFSLEDSKETFKYWKSSAKFQSLMNDLLDKKNITNDVIRFWYLDGHNYNYIADKGTGCYKTKKDKINISDVLKVEGGYRIFVPKSTCEGHLGYEIMESEKEIVIAFINGTTYTDKKTYPEGYAPVYKIRAYDRYLERNDVSDQKSPIGGEKVCSINGVFYDSLKSAIGSIPETDKETEIILHKDTYERKMNVNRNIKLVLSDKVDKSLTIYKAVDGSIFSIEQNKMMKISGRDNNVRIIIDGNSFPQQGELFEIRGRLEGRFLTLRNNINTKHGGAIQSFDGNTTLIDCIVENNKAEVAGGISLENPQCKGLFSKVIFRNNSASFHSGGLYNKGTITIQNCKFENNIAGNNGGALCNDMGGILYLYTTEIVNNTAKNNGGGIYLNGVTIIHGDNIHNNIATNFGGGLFINGENDGRKVFFDQKTVIESNSAVNGGGVYIQNGFVNYLKVSIFNNKASSDGSNTYINNGNEKQSLTIEGDKSPMLEGEIFKIRKANIVIQAKMFSLYDQKSPIIIDFPAKEGENNENGETITLFKADKYSFNDNDLKLLRVQGKEGIMTLNSEKNEIIFKIS